MKQTQKIVKKLYRPNLLAASIAALCTAMIATSVTQASDIDIYQEAKSGKVTLMFMLDISGSMGYPQKPSDVNYCDTPDGSQSGTGNEDSTNGSPTYKRYYCSVTATTTLYYYKRTGTKTSNYKYYSCGTNGSTSQSDCALSMSAAPTSAQTNGMSDSGSSANPRYYYKTTTGETTKYYDRITRVKDGLFDLLYGNTTKKITKLDDSKVIGLSTYSTPTAFDGSGAPTTADNTSGQVRIPARPLSEMVGSITQRQVLLNEIAKLGARGGTPTAHAYAETAAYLFGTRTAGTTTVSIPKFFRYYPDVTTKSGLTYFSCGSTTSTGGNTTQSTCTYTPTASTLSTLQATSGLASSTTSSTTGKVTTYTTYYSKIVSKSTTYFYKTTYTDTISTGTTPYYQSCTAFTSSGCTTWSGPADTTNPTTKSYTSASCTVGTNTGNCVYENEDFKTAAANSGFENSYSETKNTAQTFYKMPDSLSQDADIKKCSGQGIYVLTDGVPSNNGSAQSLMQNALTSTKSSTLSCTDSSVGWDCIHKFVTNLLDPVKNPVALKIKTAVVGFGSDFNDLASFDRTKTQQQNIDALGTINTDVKKAAYWGIIGEGGWYSGNSSQDVVDSVNAFLGDLNTDIPSVTTGSPTIPKDALNPAILQDDAYYQQFQPTPDKSYGLWVGNLKKYTVSASGRLQGRNNANVTDDRGRLILPTYTNGKITSAVYDFWSTNIDSNTTIADSDENTIGSRKFAAKGGVWSQLKLRTATDGTVQRKLFTNRIGTGTGTAATFGGSSSTLRQVNITDLDSTTYQNDPYRGYLFSLLGYNVDAANPSTITTASLTGSELRQVGAVMHSLPVLVTNKGKVTYNVTTKKIGSTNREDYVLFGTTQGLLHVVDASTGQEKFAFVPNEMVEEQKQGFQNYTTTSGGMANLYYGIDGPWSLYTQYVIDTSGNLTVGKGKGTNQYGKQLAFGGLRMGGRSYYSLDLQDITSPKLNFHINPDGVTSGALSYMGQSWSKPAIGYVNWGGTRKMVMFVGGGYDEGYEDPAYNQDNKKGAGVYMFSAEGSDAGTLLWWASDNATTSAATVDSGTIGTNSTNMKYSVVSEIRTVDRNGDDLIDHLYFGDLGGQVFRVDLDNTAKKLGGFAKAPVRLLNLHVGSGKSPRFYDMPSFSIYSENGKTFAAVSVGTGNRSKPLQNYTSGTADIVNDAVYNIYDKDVARKDLLTATTWNTKDITTLAEVTNTNRIKAGIKNAVGKYDYSELVAPFSSTNGWYYKFANCVTSSDGTRTGCSDYKLQSEKVFGTPLAMNYRLYVSTFDSSKPGISGDCGAGVKGESFLTTFCMPYGQCATAAETGNNNGADPDHRGISIGIGIQNATTGNCVGEQCGSGGGGSPDGEKVASASNYCANTGGRILVTTTGSAGGVAQATQMCLTPQRWYEKNTFIK